MLNLVQILLFVVVLTTAEERSKNLLEEYDLIVLGGGSGGLAAARAATLTYKKTVLVVDYVRPSPQGSFWKEGGTCVNVGCIPKKIMHYAANLDTEMTVANKLAYWVIRQDVNWPKLTKTVQDHISMANFVTHSQLTTAESKIATTYLNGRGEFVDANTIKVTLVKSRSSELSTKVIEVKGKDILIAVGGRPKYPDGIPGVKEYAITSDDLFSLKTSPGTTLIIGASYIALECAGFLRGMGYDVSVMVRSKVLRSMDEEMALLVKNKLIKDGVKFIEKSEVTKIVKTEAKWFGPKNTLSVSWTSQVEGGGESEGSGSFQTVIVAIGRAPETASLQLAKAGVTTTADGYIDATDERTNVDNIYAVGDVLYKKQELTPVAILAAKLLMDRLYGGSAVKMNYENIPTVVFTPLEYGFVGITEEKAKEKYGDSMEVYHSRFTPVEFKAGGRDIKGCFLKVITSKDADSNKEMVRGMHLFSPNAGEVIQGFAAAFKLGLTFDQLQQTVGIHPTVAEEFTRVHVTKRSGLSPEPPGCCS